MATELEIRMRLGEQRAAYEDVLQGPYLVVGYANASAQHQQLFAEYVVALRQAKAEAESWWQDLIDVETDSIGDPKEALTNVRMRRPAGSVAFGAVVHALRGAWVGCAGLNQSLGQAAANSPRVEPVPCPAIGASAKKPSDFRQNSSRSPAEVGTPCSL